MSTEARKATPTSSALFAVYVGDILISSTSLTWIVDFKQALDTAFDIKDLGACKWLLGMAVKRNLPAKTITIYQSQYIKDMLQRFGMHNSKPAATSTSINDPRAHFPTTYAIICKAAVYFLCQWVYFQSQWVYFLPVWCGRQVCI